MQYKNIQMLWPGGLPAALTSSWDDGTSADRRLVAIYKKHGLKATWNLNSGLLGCSTADSGWKDYVGADEVAELYAGQEVACHSCCHPRIHTQPKDVIRDDMLRDRQALESLVAYPVRGVATPMTSRYNANLAELYAQIGLLYARASDQINSTFDIPWDFYCWEVSCHYRDQLVERSQQFCEQQQLGRLFYLWGHSYELDDHDDWQGFEHWAENIGAREDIWHATNLQIYDYVQAWRNLRWTMDNRIVHNLSAHTIYFQYDDMQICLLPNMIKNLDEL